VRQHCAQCLTEVFTSGYDTPTGEQLCVSCYSALWGPNATDELRSLVNLHSGRPAPQLAPAQI
jgi:recombinational DNA repair protein (RecF pathway)